LPIFDKWFGSKKVVPAETKSIGYPIATVTGSPWLEAITGVGGAMTASRAMQVYRQTASVATSVDMICDEIQAIFPVLKNDKDNRIETENPVLDLLRNPNPADDWQSFLGDLGRHYLLTHEAYCYAVGSVSRDPAEIWASKPQNITRITDSIGGYPSAFMITLGPGAGGTFEKKPVKGMGWRYYDGNLKELYRIRGFTSRSDYDRPDSPLEAAAMEAKQQLLGRYHNLRLLENGGRLSLVVTFNDGTIDQDQMKARRQQLNESMGGAGNAGKIAVINANEIDIKEFGTNNKDMDFAQLDRVSREAIFGRYKIPLPLVSNDASTFNNMEQAVFHLYDRAVLPTYSLLMAGLSRMLLPRYGIDTTEWRLDYNPEAIPALQSRRIDELKRRRDIGIETTNELRALLPDRSPIQGGDTLLVPATMVPLGMDMNPGDDGFTDDELRAMVE
jgi:HK97 family phage portal protein